MTEPRYMTTPGERRFRIVGIVEDLFRRQDEDAELALAEVFGEIAKGADDPEISPLGAIALAEIGEALFPDPPRYEVGQIIWLGGNEPPCPVTVMDRWLAGTDGKWEYLVRGSGDEDEDCQEEEALETAQI